MRATYLAAEAPADPFPMVAVAIAAEAMAAVATVAVAEADPAALAAVTPIRQVVTTRKILGNELRKVAPWAASTRTAVSKF